MTTIKISSLQQDLLLFFALSLITLTPVFLFDVLPLHDLPSHMARLYVIQDGGANPLLSRWYLTDWRLVPNLALDIWAYLGIPFLDVDGAIRSFIAMSFLGLTGGTIFVHRALGGTGPWPFVSFVFLWNEIFAFGFLSFLFSVGLSLWLFGFWVRFRNGNIVVRVILHAVAAACLLVCHLFGFAVYALAVGAYESGIVVLRWRGSGWHIPNRNFFGGAVQFVPALVLFFASSTSSGAGTYSFNDLIHKLGDFSTPILLYAPEWQLIAVTAFVLVLLYSLWKKWAIIPPPCWFIVAAGSLCALLAPSMMFNSFFLSHRMPVALSFLFLATVQWQQPAAQHWRMFRRSLLVVVAAHTLYISWHWTNFQAPFRDLFAIGRTITPGSSVLSISLGTDRYSASLRPPLIRAVEYLVPTKQIFSPHILANSWHQPIRLTPEADTLVAMKPLPLFSPKEIAQGDLAKALSETDFSKFDYVMTIRLDEHEALFPDDWIQVGRSGDFRLFRTSHRDLPE